MSQEQRKSAHPGLFERIHSGDREAEVEVVALIRAFSRQIGGQLVSGGALTIDWEDLAQDSCHRFFTRGIHQYRSTGSERSYLYQLIKSTWLDNVRRLTRRKKREEKAEIKTEYTPRPGDSIDAWSILGKLSESCRDLLVRVFLDDTAYADLAGEFGLAEASLRSKVSRCIRRAREIGQ